MKRNTNHTAKKEYHVKVTCEDCENMTLECCNKCNLSMKSALEEIITPTPDILLVSSSLCSRSLRRLSGMTCSL